MPKNEGNRITVKFNLEKETKGALRYQEVDGDGNPVKEADKYKIGTLYLRKHAVDEAVPQSVDVRISY